jgi:hypothetical protein
VNTKQTRAVATQPQPHSLLEARDTLRDWVKDGQLSSNLSEKLMALADKGITKPDELCKRALKGLPRRRAA